MNDANSLQQLSQRYITLDSRTQKQQISSVARGGRGKLTRK